MDGCKIGDWVAASGAAAIYDKDPMDVAASGLSIRGRCFFSSRERGKNEERIAGVVRK